MNNDTVLGEILRRTEGTVSFFVGRTKCPVAKAVGRTSSKMSDVRPLF